MNFQGPLTWCIRRHVAHVQDGETIREVLPGWQALCIKALGLRLGTVAFKKAHATVCHPCPHRAVPCRVAIALVA